MNNKIEPYYVDFNTAKWLKEKGFNESTLTYWSKRDGLIENEITLRNHNGRGEWGTSRPEQHVVVEWLRINHGIWIQVSISRYGVFYCNILQNQKTKNLDIPMSYEMICQLNDFNSPQEAYSAAFDYIRKNNLI
jgi:hypothetical protein